MKSTFLALSLCCLSLSAGAADWSQWRGPNFNGTSPEKNLPTQWSKTEGLAWVIDLPGPSASTPIIHGDKILLSTADKQTKSMLALCVDRKTGKTLWQEKISDKYSRDDKSNFSSPSPVTDGKQAFFLYGSGDLVAFDLAGKKLWSRNIQADYGDFAYQWTYSASPLLFDGRLYVQVLQRNAPVHGAGKDGGESYLLAVDPATGKTLWKHVRPSNANAESLEAFSTPMPFQHDGQWQLLIAGGDMLSGHDPKTGTEIWRWGTWNPSRIGHWRLVPSPVAGNGVVIGCAPKGEPVYAVKLGGKGDLGDNGLFWKTSEKEVSSDVPTPAFYDGDFFILRGTNPGNNFLSRLDPQTGKAKWTVPVPTRKKLECSPTIADGKIYFMDFGADVLVMDAAKGGVLNTIPMGDAGDNETRSVIAVSQGQLFIRTNGKLYCVAGGKGVAAR